MTDKEPGPDVLVTSLLHLAPLILLPFLLFIGIEAVMITGNCANVPTCDTGPFAVAYFVVHAGVFGALALSVVVSVVLLFLRRRAWYVPIAAALVMTLSVVVAMLISGFAAYFST